MPSNKKPRKKYRPKRILVDPVAHVLEGMAPITKHRGFLTDLRITNSAAMASLMQGTAKKMEVDRLIAMSNITEALQGFGFGEEYKDAAMDGQLALHNIVQRAARIGKFVPTGVEVRQLNMLMDLHDAQMDVITVKDMEKAVDFVIQRKGDKIILPTIPEHLHG